MSRWLAGIAALFALARAASAQEASPPSLAPGTTVRATVSAGQRVVGTVVKLDADSLVLAQTTTTLRIATSSVTKLEVGYARARTTPTLIGAGLGALVGGAVGAAVGGSTKPSATGDYVGSETDAATGLFFGAAGGAVLGGIAGFNWPRWRWREASLRRVGVLPHGRGVGITIGF